MSDKQIILRLDRPPEFVGAWKLAEVLQLIAAFRQWLDNLPLSQPEQKDPA